MEAIPTLVVGYGNMGTKHARVLRDLGGPQAVWGVVDPSAERRQRAENDNRGALVFASVREALTASTKPGCAIVAASTPLHYVLTAELLEGRVPTLVEKPIAATAADGMKLAKLATDLGVPLTVGQIERFNPAAVVARRMIADGVLGTVLQLSFRRVGGSPKEVSALHDVLVDLAVHDFDLAKFITGAEVEVTDALGHYENNSLDSALVLAKSATGSGIQLQVNWRTPVKVRRIEITGSSGYLEVNLITQQVTLYRTNPLLAATQLTPESHSFFDTYLASFASPEKVEPGIERREPLREELTAFWNLVQKKAPSPVSPEDGVRAVQLTERARQLLESRR